MVRINKIVAVALSITASFSMFSQKKELKKAKSFIKSAKYWLADKELKVAAPLVKGTEYESYFYFLSGKSSFGKNNIEKYPKALKFFNKVVDIEKGDGKYSGKANSFVKIINSHYLSTISTALKANNYAKAGEVYEEYSKIYPQRRDLLINTLYSYQKANNNDKIIAVAEKLLKLDKSKFSFNATSIQAKRVEEFFKKGYRDGLVSKNRYNNPQDVKLEDKTRIDYYNILVNVYHKKEMYDKTLAVLDRAKKEFPQYYKFFEDYTTVVLKKGDKEGYIVAAEEALKLKPDNKNLWFNLGVINQELKKNSSAIAAYSKAINLDGEYYAAHLNKGVVAMSEEQALIDELNKNTSNKTKYSEANKKLVGMYLDAIKSFEQAYRIKPSERIKSALTNLYKATKQDSKIALLK